MKNGEGACSRSTIILFYTRENSIMKYEMWANIDICHLGGGVEIIFKKTTKEEEILKK